MSDLNTAVPASPEVAPASGRQRLQRVVAGLRTQGLALVLVLLVVLFALLAPGFASVSNFGDLLRDLSILGIIAVGSTFVLIGGGIDLSVGSVLLIAGIVSDDLIRLGGYNAAVAVAGALLVGCVAGLLNGLLITRLRISAFIVTLSTLYIVRGIGLSLYSSDAQDLQAAVISDDNFLVLGQNDVFGIPVSFLILVVLAAIGIFILRRTTFGLHLYALGGNELAARLTRIRVTRIQVLTYVIGGFCSALAGVILASRLQTGAPEAGLGEEFDVVAAVVIGGASLFGGRGTLIGTLLGAALITVLAKGQTLIGIPSNYQSATRGLVILIAVGLDALGQRASGAPLRVRWSRLLAPAPSADMTADVLAAPIAQPSGAAVLKARDLRKTFVEIRAVDGIDFDVFPGEVHAIVGENGAGKSTLIKMFSGVLMPDGGEIQIDGEALVLGSVAAAQDRGIAVIYQERAVVPELTVAQNIMLGHEPTRGLPGLIDRGAMRAKAEQIWALLGSPAALDAVVRELSPSVQQVVDIARALAFDARVVIMDEPTAALTQQETQRLFAIVRALRQRGTAVIYISHDLEEIFEIAGRVTVLRDGRLVRTVPVAEVDRAALIRMMIGRDIDETQRSGQDRSDAIVLRVEGLRRGAALDGVDLTVRAGEIVGVAGLVGSGRTELLRAIFGVDAIEGGSMTLLDAPYRPASPRDAVAAGVGFVPEDRKHDGFVAEFSISENLTLPNYDRVARFRLWLDRNRERVLATRMVKDLRIEPPVPRWRVNHLSGGNQQKVVLAKWLARNPRLLLVDEPTHGVDVGAREEIYRVIEDLAKTGAGIVVVSSYLPEVLRISDRIVVMREGRIVLDLPRAQADEETLLHAAAVGTA